MAWIGAPRLGSISFCTSLMGSLALLMLVLVVPPTVQLDPEEEHPGCDIPKGHEDNPRIVTEPAMPIGGVRCEARKYPVQIIWYTCEVRYCCEAGCDCDTPDLHEHAESCGSKAHSLTCFVKNGPKTNDTLYECCADHGENEDGYCVRQPCTLNNGGCSRDCIPDSDTNGLEHTCGCPDPLELGIDDKTCIDPAPCAKAQCDHECVVDSSGGAQCTCHDGFTLDQSDGLTCIGPQTPEPQPRVDDDDDSGLPLYITVGVPLALLALAVLFILCIFFVLRRRRRKEVPDTAPIGGTPAFSHPTYEMTPGQATGVTPIIGKTGPLPDKPGIDNPTFNPDEEMGAMGLDPHYETLPEKKDPGPDANGRVMNEYGTLPDKKCPLPGPVVEPDPVPSSSKSKAEEAVAAADSSTADQHYANVPPAERHYANMTPTTRDSTIITDIENLNNILSEGRLYDDVSPRNQ